MTKEEITKGIKENKIYLYSDELIKKARNINKNGLPLSIYILSKKYCDGLCSEMAFDMTKLVDNPKYVRGNINLYKISNDPNHVWVEDDSFVYDTTQGLIFDKNYYYEYFNAKIVNTYNNEELKDENILSNFKQKYIGELSLQEKLGFIYVCLKKEKENPSINTDRLINEINLYLNGKTIDENSLKDNIMEWDYFYTIKK